MKGYNGCGFPYYNPNTGLPTKYVYSGNVCTGTGWRDVVAGDKRNIINSGPFNMASGDTQVVVYSYSVARSSSNIQSVCELVASSDYLKEYYYNCFNLIGIEPIGNYIPVQYSLNQNYPNPFNPVTSIKFGIPKQSNVKLIVYDALGREVAALIDSELKAGNYSVDWNAADSPSGVYFYRLITTDYSETRKMILIK